MGPGRSRRFRGLGHAGAALSGHFVRTNPSTGLTSRLADRVVQLLTEDSPLPGPIRAPQPLALRRGGSAATRDADGAATCTPYRRVSASGRAGHLQPGPRGPCSAALGPR